MENQTVSSTEVDQYESHGWAAVEDTDTVRETLDNSPLFQSKNGAVYESKTGDMKVGFATREDGTETVTYMFDSVTSTRSVYAAAETFQNALANDPDVDQSYVEEVGQDLAMGAAQQAEDSTRSSVLEHFGFQQVATDGGKQTMADVSHQRDELYAEGVEAVDGAQNTFT